MTHTYWVEMTLGVSDDRSVVEKLVSEIEDLHGDRGQVVYAYTPKTGRLALAMSVVSDDDIEIIPAKVVGMVRSAAHGLGYETPNWPEPVGLDHVRMKAFAIEDVRIKSLAA